MKFETLQKKKTYTHRKGSVCLSLSYHNMPFACYIHLYWYKPFTSPIHIYSKYKMCTMPNYHIDTLPIDYICKRKFENLKGPLHIILELF